MSKLHRRLLVITLVVSVVLRVLAALYIGNEVEELPGTFDQISYHNLALRVVSGYGFTFGEPWWPATPASEPTAHWSYLYTGYLIAIYNLLGQVPLAARVIQAILVGLLQPFLVSGLLAMRVSVAYVGRVGSVIPSLRAVSPSPGSPVSSCRPRSRPSPAS